ncbi:hypothetical protein PsorP6_006239 [Peronosclerospora sorghi]|uniref:Uncharacterized protein n=1 Tax=Peronosclerospora sorghi TaxID=230839 RepID=A0ACC0W3E6_9STRA|nr:hypothetical protein PsorP6_006239 [Peronosclerospora sorghi]
MPRPELDSSALELFSTALLAHSAKFSTFYTLICAEFAGPAFRHFGERPYIMPFWYNLHFTFGKGKSPLSDVSNPTNSALKSLGFSRLQDYVNLYGTYVTKDILLSLLEVSTFARPTSRTRLVTDTMTRFNLLLPQDGPRHGPIRSPPVQSACHDLRLNVVLVIDMKNRDFVHLLSKNHPNKEDVSLPLRQLNVPSFHPTEDVWSIELTWDRYVLLVFLDVKYRLQHNAMGFLYNFQRRLHQLDWVFPSSLRIHPKTTQDYGDRIFWAVFSVVRCFFIRTIWLHRNKRLYNSDITTS